MKRTTRTTVALCAAFIGVLILAATITGVPWWQIAWVESAATAGWIALLLVRTTPQAQPLAAVATEDEDETDDED